MDQGFKIIIADRNPNVGKLLRRELMGEGYRVILAREGHELTQLLNEKEPPDLLILDPDIPSFLSKSELIELLHLYRPTLPIVIYTFIYSDINYVDLPGVVVCLEKGENTDRLIKVVGEVLNKDSRQGYSTINN